MKRSRMCATDAPDQILRTGFTTGACAAAAARAAVRGLTGAELPHIIKIKLPKGDFNFAVACSRADNGTVTCGVVKDAGDDPDVTHGLEIRAAAAWQETSGVTICGGEGVGVVTLPGLPLAVGEAAINPGPQRLIRAAVEEELKSAEVQGMERMGPGISIEISVPQGRRIAGLTMNPKLGIRDGISILGTDGLVRPYSTAAYRTSVYYACKVAAAAGKTTLVLTTGRRTEAYAARLLNIQDGIGLVNAGDDIAYALNQAQKLGFQQVILSGMIGKLTKLAQGRLNVHVDQGGVDFAFLAELARDLGYPGDLETIRQAKTAHFVQAALRKANTPGLEAALAERTARQIRAAGQGKLGVRVLLFSLHGELLADARAEKEDE